MNLTWLEFTLAALATYRLSLLVSKEDGPAMIFARLRKVPARGSSAHDWLTCIFCFSMTASAIICLALWLAGTRGHYAQWFILWTALSSVAIVVNQSFTKGKL